MYVPLTKPFFAWDCLEDNPSLASIRAFLAAVPDAQLLEGLRRHRGRGRDDYPVSVLWGVLLLTILLRHVSIAACLEELQRHDALCQLIGIDSQEHIPKAWNMSRFLDVLGQEPHLTNLRATVAAMVERLGTLVADLGQHIAGDSAALNARRSRQQAKDPKTPAASPATTADKIEYDHHGLPQPAGGRKEYQDDQGTVIKVVEWLGYKFHLLVDVRHQVVLAHRVTSTKTGDNEVLADLLDQGQANLPADRIETLAYDKAADDEKVHEDLQQRKRLFWLLVVGVVLIGTTAAYVEFHFHLPEGEGPAGPAVPLEPFERPWTERKILLLGLGDSVTAGFGSRRGHSYFDRLVANPADEFADMRGRSLSRVLPGLMTRNIAVSGSNSLQHLQLVRDKLEKQPEDVFGLVVMTSGGNDLIHWYGRRAPQEGAMYGTTLQEAEPWIANYENRLNRLKSSLPALHHGAANSIILEQPERIGTP